MRWPGLIPFLIRLLLTGWGVPTVPPGRQCRVSGCVTEQDDRCHGHFCREHCVAYCPTISDGKHERNTCMSLWWQRQKLRRDVAEAALAHYKDNPGVRDVPLDVYVDRVFGKVETAVRGEGPEKAA